MTEIEQKPSRRVRPGLRRVAILAFAVLIPVAAHSLWDYVEIRRLTRELDAIRAKGEPVTEADAGRGGRKLTADEELAARHFIAAAVLAQPVMQGRWNGLGPLDAYLAGLTEREPDRANLVEDLRVRVDDGRIAIELSDRAGTLPFVSFPPGFNYSYREQELTSLLRLRSVLAAHLSLADQGDQAVEAARRVIRARPVLNDEMPWARPVIRDVAIVLSLSRPSSAALRGLLADLQAHHQPDRYERGLMADRAVFIERLLAEFYGGVPRLPPPTGRRSHGFVQTLWRPWFTHRFVAMIQGWNQLVESSRKPWPAKYHEAIAIYDRLGQPVHVSTLFSGGGAEAYLRWLVPVGSSLVLTVMPPRPFEALTTDSAAIAAVAVALFRLDHGRLPSSLEDLRGTYLEQLPIDPFTGQSLRLRSDDRSFTIYSVGPDGQDDDGDLVSRLRDVDQRGWGVRAIAGKDVGVRVLLKADAPIR